MTITQAGAGADTDVRALAQAATERAVGHLTGLQDAAGWWRGELETNVTMDAEDLLLREFLGIRTAGQTAAAARWIRSRQRADGTWSNWYGGRPDLSTTIEAYIALRLAGDEPGAPHMDSAARWVRAAGGIGASRVFTRIWLALFGEWPWQDLPAMPPELIYLPSWFPLNVYDWACWARQTIVPLTVVGSLQPVRPLPFGLDELRPAPGPAGPARAADPVSRLFGELDRALRVYERHGLRAAPARAGRTAALRRCAEWIIARQEQDGCWGGIQPPWVYSLLALHLLGYGLDHPVIKHGLAGLDRFTVWEEGPDGPVRRMEACQSPVWDTVLAMTALADAGLPRSHPVMMSAARWVLSEEIRGPGDWQVRRPGLEPGGWAFEFDNDGYPDIDDTAEAVLALGRTQLRAWPGAEAAMARAIRWLIGMQSRDGGWGAFDADNTSRLVARLPFCDFGEVTDPPSADVTAHVVEALAAAGMADSQAAGAGSSGCCGRRSRTDPGSAGGAPTTCTAPARWCPPSSRRGCGPASRPSAGPWPGCSRTRTATAAGARTCAPTRTRSSPGGASPPRRRRPGRSWRCWPRAARRHSRASSAASDGWPGRSARTGPGTSRSSPAPGSPAISPSTITSTG